VSWSQDDRDLYRALRQVEDVDEAHKCPVCGGDARECQDPKNQHAFETVFTRCYRTNSVSHAMDGRRGDPDARALAASTRFHPELVKQT
jgi:hypothetical protein